jgi:hypothetical protein
VLAHGRTPQQQQLGFATPKQEHLKSSCKQTSVQKEFCHLLHITILLTLFLFVSDPELQGHGPASSSSRGA